MPHFPEPSVGSVVVGRLIAGPTPQMRPLLLAGLRNHESRKLAVPEVDGAPGTREGWLMYGMISRPIRFQLGVRWKGTTGWKFMTKRRSSLGPTPFSQLNWRGRLARSATGFDSCFASASGAAVAPAAATSCWARAAAVAKNPANEAAAAMRSVLRAFILINDLPKGRLDALP